MKTRLVQVELFIIPPQSSGHAVFGISLID